MRIFKCGRKERVCVFWFRNPLTETRSSLAWTVRDVFEAGKVRDIVATYDGSDAFIYLDGNSRAARLSPESRRKFPAPPIDHQDRGTGGVQPCVRHARFFAGRVIDWRGGAENIPPEYISASGWLSWGGFFLRCCLEILLVGVSGRRIWAGNIALSLFFGLAGILLINADRRFKSFPRALVKFGKAKIVLMWRRLQPVGFRPCKA